MTGRAGVQVFEAGRGLPGLVVDERGVGRRVGEDAGTRGCGDAGMGAEERMRARSWSAGSPAGEFGLGRHEFAAEGFGGLTG